MIIKTKYAPKDVVVINGQHYTILGVDIHSINFGWDDYKVFHKITYHVQDKNGEGCRVLEQMIEKKIPRKGVKKR